MKDSIKKEERFTVINPKDFHEHFVVKEDKYGNLYLELWNREGCVYNETLRQFLKDIF